MKKMIAAIAILAALSILGIAVVSGLLNINNTCVVMENGIKAQYDLNRNSYDQHYKTMKEMAQVPDMQADDFKKIYDGVMAGRYGKDGSRAVVQWIQENNPQLSKEVYIKLQTAIEAGRNRFASDQTMLVDKKNDYANYIGTQPTEFFASSILGFPKIDMSKYDIVTSDETEKAFTDKKSEPIKLR